MTVVIAALLVVVVWSVLIFNQLVRARNQTSAAWGDIDVQLQRRHDLVPQLVEAVKGYVGYEQATLDAITELRSKSIAASRLVEKARMEDQLQMGLHKLIAIAEDYPDLKASENFLALQEDLTEVEDHLQYARRFYNGAVRQLNTRIESFPDLIIARAFSFRPGEFFDAEPAAESAPRISVS